MRRGELQKIFVAVAAGGALLAGGAQGIAQSQQDAPATPPPTPPAAKSQGSKPSQAQDDKSSAADNNAFPAAQSQAAQDKATQSQSSGAAPSTSDANPFPEEESKKAEKDAEAGERNGDAGPAKDSNGGAPESSSRTGLDKLDLLGDHDSRISNGAGGFIHDPQLAKTDINAGQFYMGSGNYAGAYGRFKEATEVDADNIDAVYLLAEAARKTQHLDEAASNYQLYLTANPKGKHAKDARKALDQLAGK